MTDNLYFALQGLVAFLIGWALAVIFNGLMRKKSKRDGSRDDW